MNRVLLVPNFSFLYTVANLLLIDLVRKKNPMFETHVRLVILT